MLFGVTGNIGSGKTSVARMLGELIGVPVLNADGLCRELMQPGREGFQKFIEVVGDVFLDDSGSIDRSLLRKAVFENPGLKGTIESILHPLVRGIVMTAKARCRPGSAVVAEIPLLFELGWESDFDLIVTVSAPVDKTLLRVVGRDGGSKEDVMAILNAQMDQEKKCRKAHFVIDNSGAWEETEKQIIELGKVVQEKFMESQIRI